MANTTTVVPASVTFASGTGGAFQSVQTPGELPVFTDQTANVYMSQEFVVPAEGAAINPPSVYDGTVRLIQIVNVDPTGYVALTLYSTDDGPYAVLAPDGGMFMTTSTGVAIDPAGSGNSFPVSPDALQLRSCDSAGILANGTATRVRLTVLAAV